MNDISKDKIDITMTATLRPEIFLETIHGIQKCIIGKKHNNGRYRLILNIDQIGEKIPPKEMIRIAKKHFKNVVYNISKTPSFCSAVKWVWSQATADYIFHIEDDWKFLKKIDVDDMIRILQKYEKLSSLRLYKHNTPNINRLKTFACVWDYNTDGFYMARNWRRQFGLNPILIKKEFIDMALPKMVDNTNPEKQFRYSQKYMVDVIKQWKYGLYCKPGDKRTVDDNGRNWIRQQKLKKNKGSFMTWVEM